MKALQEKYNQLANQVYGMRHYQRLYFKHHASLDRTKAMRYEKKVDELIERELKERKKNEPQQPGLF